MSIEEIDGASPPRGRGWEDTGPMAPPSEEPDGPRTHPARPGPGLGSTLSELAGRLGFETASVFVPGPGGWELLERIGPSRAWHGVLDPSVLGGAPEAAEYSDVRTLPGVGSRLAGLGCASVAILPLPEGGRVVLDSSRPSPQTGWLSQLRPYLALAAHLTGTGWVSGGGLRSRQEVRSLHRAFEVCQELLARPSATDEELLEGVRAAVAADELFVVTERGGGLDVAAAAAPGWPARLDGHRLTGLTGGGPLDGADVAWLASELSAASRTVGASLGRGGVEPEVVVVGWSHGPALSEESMSVLARTVSTARSALLTRGRAVDAMVDRERARMAYALHDGLTQTVAGAVLELEALRRQVERDPREATATLERSKVEIRKALAEIRAFLFELSDSSDQATEEPLGRYVQDVVKRWRLPARVAMEGDLGRVPPTTRSIAYVVIREALANAAKHAAGSNVTVHLVAGDDELRVEVGDAGAGFTQQEEDAARDEHHFGLEMLRRRVRDAGGMLTVRSRPGQGTRVTATLPLRKVAS